MTEHKNSKLLLDDSIVVMRKLMDSKQFSTSRENTGKVKDSIRKPGPAMIEAVTRLIYYFEKGS
jgi:hypothetical protein